MILSLGLLGRTSLKISIPSALGRKHCSQTRSKTNQGHPESKTRTLERSTSRHPRYGKDTAGEAHAAMVLAAAKEEEEVEPAIEPWSEPEKLEDMLDQYIIEGKFAGRSPGTTMYLVQAKKRDGTLEQVVAGQRCKLFLAPRLN